MAGSKYTWSGKIANSGHSVNIKRFNNVEEELLNNSIAMVRGVRVEYACLWGDVTIVTGLKLWYDDHDHNKFYIFGTIKVDHPHFNEVFLNPFEHINKIECRSGNVLDSITFYTNQNRRIGPYGGTGGSPETLTPPQPDGFLAGIRGEETRIGETSVIRALEFCWGSTN